LRSRNEKASSSVLDLKAPQSKAPSCFCGVLPNPKRVSTSPSTVASPSARICERIFDSTRRHWAISSVSPSLV